MTKKDPKRKEKIIQTAMELFTEKGYESTTIDEIRNRLGISKGAFYHYFDSKQDLLDAVIEFITLNILETSLQSMQDPTLNPIQKLVAFFTGGREWRMKHMKLLLETTGLLFRPENALLLMKVFKRNIAIVKPIMVQILEEGKEKRVINIEEPEILGEILLFFFSSLSIYFFHSFHKMRSRHAPPQEIIKCWSKRVNISVGVVERILGIKPGVLPRMCEQEFKQIEKWLEGEAK